ncbi:MAG TPA: FtsW/RodA/SpoVE family cell cycle protein [Anaerolineales bacterium]|nr:FtsW/RodA/SpoVE family cell cycle protein [Anaerolineales bacterium]
MIRAISWRHFDFLLLGAVAVLTIFGITMIRSAVAGNIELTTETNLVERQIIFAVLGFVMVILIAGIDYHLWASLSRTLYLGTAIALAILNVAAAAVFGSARWFQVLQINIQPSELAKIVIILVLADYFTHRQEQLDDINTVLRSLIFTLGIVVWVILQPNLSTSILIMVIWFSLLWASGLRLRHLVAFIGVGLAASAILLPILFRLDVIKQYQLDRVTAFLFPDPNARFGDIYNIQQALISIGSGGWFGQGYGSGPQVQLRFLKVRWSDFIFSAMAEEFGFIGTLLVILLIIFVIFRCLRAARLARDTFGGLIAFGVAAMIAFQTAVNIGVNLRLLPATGLTLPFISYGGSSLFTALMGIGLVQSVILRHKALEF